MATEYNKVILDGYLPGNEAFSTSFAMKGVLTGGPDIIWDDQGSLQDAADRAQDFLETPANWSYMGSLLGADGGIKRIRVEYRVGPDLVLAAANDVSITGAGTANRHPNQCSVVFSLRTGLPGRSRRGRMYWPAVANPLINDQGQFSVALAEDLAQDLANFEDAVGDMSLSEDSTMGVYSPKLDEFTTVKYIQVGTVIDTQRRRRDQLVETYARVDLA